MTGRNQLIESLQNQLGLKEFDIELDGENCTVKTARPLLYPQPPNLGERTAIWNDISVARQLTQAFLRDHLDLEADAGFTISLLRRTEAEAQSVAQSNESIEGHVYRMRIEPAESRRGRIESAQATYEYGRALSKICVVFEFGVLPSSAVRFIRKRRNFSDFMEFQIEPPSAIVSKISDWNYKYRSGENDRLIDGVRADHVPALTVVRFVLSALPISAPAHREFSLRFEQYLDPRSEFDLGFDRNFSEVEILQDGARTVLGQIS